MEDQQGERAREQRCIFQDVVLLTSSCWKWIFFEQRSNSRIGGTIFDYAVLNEKIATRILDSTILVPFLRMVNVVFIALYYNSGEERI